MCGSHVWIYQQLNTNFPEMAPGIPSTPPVKEKYDLTSLEAPFRHC